MYGRDVGGGMIQDFKHLLHGRREGVDRSTILHILFPVAQDWRGRRGLIYDFAHFVSIAREGRRSADISTRFYVPINYACILV